MRNPDVGLVFRTDRLTLFAHYLKNLKFSLKITLLEDLDFLFHDEEISVFPVFEDVIRCIPKLFKDWSINSEEEVIWNQKPNQCTLTSIIEFFGVERALFIHLFVPYGQVTSEFSGYEITKKSSAKDISKNIFRIILLRHYIKQQPSFSFIPPANNSLIN